MNAVRNSIGAVAFAVACIAASFSPLANAHDVASGALNLGGTFSTGTIVSNSGITGNTESTAVSNLAGTGTSQYRTSAQTGGQTIIGGTIGSASTVGNVNQSSYANVNTTGSISGNAQPMDGALTANGAGSYADTKTAAVETTTFNAVGANLNLAGSLQLKGFSPF
jgi:hypothetical protein